VFGIGGPELIVIVVVALLFVGPDKLPQVAKTVTTGLRDLRRAANLAQHELRHTMDELARDADLDGIRRDLQAATQPAPETQAEPQPWHEPPRPPQDGEVLATIRKRLVNAPPDPNREPPAVPPVPVEAVADSASDLPPPLPPDAPPRSFGPVAGTAAHTAATRSQVPTAAESDADLPPPLPQTSRVDEA
jgi:Tat protein translocase TatB subunit